ncbi:MAG: molybdopterin-dependent oxidoreductase [Pseudomonadota bacterium]
MNALSRLVRASAAAFALVLAFTSLVAAETLVVLDAKAAGETEVTRSDLEAMAQVEVSTTTEWTDGVTRFVGPKIRDVLERAGLDEANAVRAIAANDYAVEIPVADLLTYDAILAMRMNGEPLSLRNKGPLWIVFPRDEHEALADPVFNTYWIWQLIRIEEL